MASFRRSPPVYWSSGFWPFFSCSFHLAAPSMEYSDGLKSTVNSSPVSSFLTLSFSRGFGIR